MIGHMSGQIEMLIREQQTTRAEIKKDIGALFAMVNALNAEGCARGKEHTRDIAELKGRPERTVSVVAAIVAALSALIAWWKG
jgi:hypothetical protein